VIEGERSRSSERQRQAGSQKGQHEFDAVGDEEACRQMAPTGDDWAVRGEGGRFLVMVLMVMLLSRAVFVC